LALPVEFLAGARAYLIAPWTPDPPWWARLLAAFALLSVPISLGVGSWFASGLVESSLFPRILLTVAGILCASGALCLVAGAVVLKGRRLGST